MSELTGLQEGDSYDGVVCDISYRLAGRFLLGAFIRSVHYNKVMMNSVDLYCSLWFVAEVHDTVI